MTATEEELKQVASSLRELSSRKAVSTSSTPLSVDLLVESTPLFSDLKRINRNVYLDVLKQKERVGEERSKVDTARLLLQNLKYEQNMLEQEVRACQDFQSIYQDIPLQSMEEFAAARSASDTMEEESDSHATMLARLQFELDERTRLQTQVKELQNQKSDVIKENKLKKAKLEKIEKSLKDLSSAAHSIQDSLESF